MVQGNQQNNPNVTNNLPNEMNNLMNNPAAFLARRKLNLPQNFQGGPREMVQHLLNSGQMNQNDFNRLQQFVNRVMPLK